jgi:hypothetical protein
MRVIKGEARQSGIFCDRLQTLRSTGEVVELVEVSLKPIRGQLKRRGQSQTEQDLDLLQLVLEDISLMVLK